MGHALPHNGRGVDEGGRWCILLPAFSQPHIQFSLISIIQGALVMTSMALPGENLLA
jgi:hypothetical protein